MQSTMPERPLTIGAILAHGRVVFADSEVVTLEGDRTRHARFDEVAAGAARLANALRRLGIAEGDRVGTLCWNTQEHFEAYLAVPSMGAVLHTLNLRLFPEQLSYVINHAEDRIVIVDDSLVPVLARVQGTLTSVERIIVVGDGDASPLGEVLRYGELVAAESDDHDWPELDERSAAAMCYTSGTTGNPKGVVYSHRSSYLHSMASAMGNCFALTQHDRVLPIVPMFHANSWGLPYTSFMAGADLILPGRFLQAAPMCRLIEAERPTIAGAVPSILNDILRHLESHTADISSLRLVLSGGSAVPLSLQQRFQERHGIPIMQAWGMTETSPLAAVSQPPKHGAPEDEWRYRCKSGRVAVGVEVRHVADDGTVLPWDGASVGEIEVRGNWVTAAYHRDPAPDRFDDGWLRTGDVGTVDGRGFIQLTDRAKDVIKSGGEWISSIDLEAAIMAHPAVVEAAVIAVADERWDERPLACVVVDRGSVVTVDELRRFLDGRVARWWVPERWSFVDEVPKTSVGKFDKKLLRARLGDGALEILGDQVASR
jgi:acyl-CoA synthetase (AMP-forming)/AMP-acid ligase II